MFHKDSKYSHSQHIQLNIDPDDNEYYSSYGEYTVNCGNIIFLPFNTLWEFFIMCLVVLNTLTVSYDTLFHHDDNWGMDEKDVVFYLIYFIYLFDTVLSILHKNMPYYRKTREYEPKFFPYLVIDVITLLPIYQLYLLIKTTANRPVYNKNVETICKMLTYLRLYRVYDYFHKISYNAGINQIMFVFMGQYFKLVILTEFVAGIWYAISCWKCDKKNWTQSLKEIHFDPKRPLNWLIICGVTIGNAFTHNSKGDIGCVNMTEQIVLLLTMLCGFVIHFMMYYGQLTWAYVKSFRRQLTFVQNLTSIKGLLKDLHIDKTWENKTVEYYGIFWARRQGIKEMPHKFKSLPPPLQKEVTVDIYWEALRHSHLFRDEDMSFKRALSSVMKCEFLLAGDYIYKVREMKCKMVYIVTGILQILTDEDEESPIISFSSGTILGEYCCLFPQKNTTNVRSATYSELHTLSFKDLDKVLENYPKKRKHLFEKVRRRIIKAKEINELKNTSTTSMDTNLHRETSTSIKWIKSQWQGLSEKRVKKHETVDPFVNRVHTSKYLDMLVLTKELELKMQVICLRGSCPFIFEPNSSFLHFFQHIVLFATILQAIVVPYYAAFVRTMSIRTLGLCLLFDILYWLDIYLKLSTAYDLKHTLLSSSSAIIRRQFMSGSFILDVLSSIPIDYFVIGNNPRLATVIKLNRVLKIYQLFAYIISLEDNIWFSDLKAKILKFSFIYLTTAYWMTCLSYITSCYHEKCTQHGWFAHYMEERNLTEMTPFQAFIATLFNVCTVFFSIALNDAHYNLIGDIILHHCIILVGYFVFSFWVSTLTATFIIYSEKHSNYRHYYSSTIKTVEGTNMPVKLKQQFKSMLQFWWYYNKNEELTGPNGILIDATVDLKNKLIKERIINCLRSVLLFSLCDDIMLDAIAEKSTIKILPPNAEIVTVASRTNWLHVILRGYVYRYSNISGDRDKRGIILNPGDLFPIFGVLYQIVTLLNCVSITNVELISISYDDLLDIFHKNPETAKSFLETIKWHLATHETLLLCKSGRLQDMIPTEHSLGQGNYFTYKITDEERITREEKCYLKPWTALGRWSFVRYLILRRTISPEGKFFFYWEFIRCILILVKIYLTLTKFNLLIQHESVIVQILRAITITSILDIYIRMHCQYYNEKGILVTHPWSTCTNYIYTSFFIDLLSITPFEMLQIDAIFGEDRKKTFNIFLLVFSNSFQLYRVIGFINYFQGSVHNTSNKLKSLKYTCVALYVLLGATSIFHILICPLHFSENYDPAKNTVTCNAKSWIASLPFQGDLTPVSLHVLYLYTVVGIFTSSFPSVLRIYFPHELIVLLITIMVLFVFRWTTFALMATAKLGANISLTKYQERTKAFIHFAESEYMDDDLIKQTVEYYQYNWKKIAGGSIDPTLQKFHPNLHAEVVFNLYGPSMELVEIFQGVDSGFFRTLGILMEIRHFKKDSDIIRINDVQGLVYIVYKGKVDIKVAGMRITTLGNGAMFGCFNNKGKMRQTINASAKVHLELLTVDSIAFHNVISHFPEVMQRLNDLITIGYEYAESRKRINFNTNDLMLSQIKTKASCCKSILQAIVSKITVSINHNNKWYKLWEYLICVHLSHVNAFFFMIRFTTSNNSAYDFVGVVVLYLLDALIYIKIYIQFNLTYVDNESGLTIRSPTLISLRYIKSMTFWIDIISIVPFELLTILKIPFNSDSVYFTANRLLRIYYLSHYYEKSENKLNIKVQLRWTFMLYWILITLEVMTCFWWAIECKYGHCKFWMLSTIHDGEMIDVGYGLAALVMTFKYVVNLFTMSGMIDIEPRTMKEILGTIAISVIFQHTIMYLSGEFASLSGVGQYLKNNYEFQIRKLSVYLKGRELSKPLVDKVWTYNLQLWRRQRGDGIPKIIRGAPAYLKQDLMNALYGSHLANHVLFSSTHVDFLRQLVVHLQRFLFFPGNYLAEKGDIDGCMYFIHHGEVEIYDKNGDNYIHVSRVLNKGDSFGEQQGLYNIPHIATYRARTIVDAVLLEKSDWQYLLEWYPASSDEIFRQARWLINQPLADNSLKV